MASAHDDGASKARTTAGGGRSPTRRRPTVSIGRCVADNPIRMGNRHDYLARVLRILSSDLIDGVMATMDVLEDLLVIHDLMLALGVERFQIRISNRMVLNGLLEELGLAGNTAPILRSARTLTAAESFASGSTLVI